MRRRIFQTQKDFHNLPEDTIFDDWHIDCTYGQGINDVTTAIELIKDNGNRAILTVNAEDAKGHKSSWHTAFTTEKWEDFKDSVNDNGMTIIDVWVTEETDGKGSLHNSRRARRIRSSYEEQMITPYTRDAYDSDFDLGLSAVIDMYGDEFIQLSESVLTEPHTLEILARYFDYEAFGRDFRIETGAEWDSERRVWTY